MCKDQPIIKANNSLHQDVEKINTRWKGTRFGSPVKAKQKWWTSGNYDIFLQCKSLWVLFSDLHNLDIREKTRLPLKTTKYKHFFLNTQKTCICHCVKKGEKYEIRSSSVQRKEKYKHLQKGEGKQSKSMCASLQVNGTSGKLFSEA